MIKPIHAGWDLASGPDYGVTIEASIRDQRYINITTTIAGRVHQKTLDTEERFIREGLIKLGWTPPARD